VAAAAAFAALLLGCVVMALVGGAAAQGPRLPSDYKTLSGNAPQPSFLLYSFLDGSTRAVPSCLHLQHSSASLRACYCFRASVPAGKPNWGLLGDACSGVS